MYEVAFKDIVYYVMEFYFIHVQRATFQYGRIYEGLTHPCIILVT